ncbi:DUF6362 family protein [Pararoseomonas indoligenes]|uniref:DUF6362 domain-containing protein n=1 Tax=Roseomonas indoligenes TaxID=2820811 RepID=A0A940MX87_9PROT|nr:DUF6362 family protein [Pararoseomonas indoligenes]MBP0492857.1 hypothetical protein [Pararoseomonas indoligenes]
MTTQPLAAQASELPWPIYDNEVVEMRLCDATDTLRALPGRGCFPAGFRTNWPAEALAMAEAAPAGDDDLPRKIPTARQIDQMDEAFQWIGFIPGEHVVHRRIVLLRSLISVRQKKNLLSWRQIGEKLGMEHRTVQRRFAEAIGWICQELYRQQLAGKPWAVEWQRMRQVAGSLNTKQLVPENSPIAPPAEPGPVRDPAIRSSHYEPITYSVSERAERITRFLSCMSGRCQAAMEHFPTDGSPRLVAGGRGFGMQELVVLEGVGILAAEPGGREYRFTADGVTARAMWGRTAGAA